MESLITKLEKEAGLTEEQAEKTIAIILDYMSENGISIDWNRFLKGKYKEMVEKSRKTLKDVSKKASKLSDKIEDKVEDLSLEAKHKARDLTKKIYDKLDD